MTIGGIILAFTTSWLVSMIFLAVIPIVLIAYYFGEKYIDQLWGLFNESSNNGSVESRGSPHAVPHSESVR
jgi:ABC-type multidrug transport system fused ATPase/permease subunit